MKLRQWRMRTTLMVSLLSVSLGLTAMSLLVVRFSVKEQIRSNLDSDLQHSLATFRNLTSQKNQMLSREAALLADLPSLKALMATSDMATIGDGSREFWQLSESDFFALTGSGGKLYTHFNRGQQLSDVAVTEQLLPCLERSPAPCLLFSDNRLYVLTAQRLFFGPSLQGSELGFIIIGYEVDTRVANEVGEAAAADVAFQVGTQTAASTLPSDLVTKLHMISDLDGTALRQGDTNRADSTSFVTYKLEGSESKPIGEDVPIRWLRLGVEDYRTASESLGYAQNVPVKLVVLKSYDRASEYLRQVNRWMATLGLLAILVGGLLAIAISRTVTRPLEVLVEGTRALGQGDFDFHLEASGAAELREVGSAFEHMRLELKTKQVQLMESDRLATIGRMASSVSHDLRHHLSAIYANAEFMSLAKTGKEERLELLTEVQDAVQDMTDLIESLLFFSRTGQTLHRSLQPVFPVIERTGQAIRRHPQARNVVLTIQLVSASNADAYAIFDELPEHSSHESPYAWIDARALSRAVFNIMLNACQAAGQASVRPHVLVTVRDLEDAVAITVEDNGPGIPESIRNTMFQPFVSAGKENGTGLGLTLAQHIAQEHGGEVSLDHSQFGKTRFTISLLRKAWRHLTPEVLAQRQETNEDWLPVADTGLHSTYDSSGDEI